MPSFSNDFSYQQSAAKATNHRPVDSQQGKSQDKAAVGNTFLWTNWPNGDSNHLDPAQNNHHLLTNLKNGGAYSMNASRPGVSSHTRDEPRSKGGDMQSLGNGPAPDSRDSGPTSTAPDRDYARDSSDTGPGFGSAAASKSRDQVNGTSLSSGIPTVNGDYPPPSRDELASPESVGPATVPRLLSFQAEETGRLSHESGRLSPGAISSGINRYSSPPAPARMDSSNPQESADHGLRHRHTLQVPRSSSTRRSSRDQSEDTYSTGRLSPTSGIRRTSLSLVRRATRSIDETAPGEDSTRWTEAIKHRRASKRRRRDDDDDDRVIVGTKVDHNHVNWVTAYNMLTGIRFTVSRINAKMDRELTPADFQARHKFSFDM